jgi:hypothetical protein
MTATPSGRFAAISPPPGSTLVAQGAIRQSWQLAEERFLTLLDGLDATEDTFTTVVRLIPHVVNSFEEFGHQLTARGAGGDGTWAIATAVDESGERRAFALPVTSRRQSDPLLFMFVEIHTLLVAWWLTYAWRARQLARTGAALNDAGDAIAAAAVVRALVETAASFWSDGKRVAAAWADLKAAGKPMTDKDAFERRAKMMAVLNEISWGAKFDDRAPALKKNYARVERTNVLSAVDKLAKASSATLQDDYQWLCNTVHPSIGNTFVFSAPTFVHDTETHMVTWFCGRPLHVEERGGNVMVERTIQDATGRAATVSLNVLSLVMDSALHVVDDVALTTEASTLRRDPYWRNLTRTTRNLPCPCRSGRKAKYCYHEWGAAAPEFPSTFGADEMK